MSVLPAKKNFTIWRGGTWRKALTIYTGATTASDPRDLTGYTASLRVEDAADSILMTLTEVASDDGQILLGGLAGTVTILIPANVTETITWSNAIYELRITAPLAGDTDPILWGSLVVKGV